MSPPTRKNTNDVTRYIRPICFASVVRRMRANAEPLSSLRTGHGRVTMGCGSIATRTLLVPFITSAPHVSSHGAPSQQDSG